MEMAMYPSQRDNMQKLQKWLEYEISASSLYIFSWFWGILLFLVMIAAIVFIPFMLKVLYEYKKFGWIVYFIIMVILPTILIYLIDLDITYKLIFGYIPLGLFFFYCLTLKFAVRGWVLDMKFRRGETVFHENPTDIFNNYKF